MISREKMIALYSAMVKYRALASQVQAIAKQKNPAPPLTLAPGRESIMAAITADLRGVDFFAATQSTLAPVFVPASKRKNSPDVASTNGYFGKQAVSSADAIKAARKLKTSKSEGIAVIFCEAHMKAADWRKQLQQVSREDLPLVFVRLRKQQSNKSVNAFVTSDAYAYGVPLIAVDAHDVLAAYRVASESVARARARRGPTLIECVDFSEHSAATSADPIEAMESVLSKKRILNSALKKKIETNIRREVKKALAQPAR